MLAVALTLLLSNRNQTRAGPHCSLGLYREKAAAGGADDAWGRKAHARGVALRAGAAIAVPVRVTRYQTSSRAENNADSLVRSSPIVSP